MQKLTYVLHGTDQYSVITSSVSSLVLYSLTYMGFTAQQRDNEKKIFLVEIRLVPKSKWSIRYYFRFFYCLALQLVPFNYKRQQFFRNPKLSLLFAIISLPSEW